MKYYVLFTIKYNPFYVNISLAISVCLWLHIQSLVDVVTVLVRCVNYSRKRCCDTYFYDTNCAFCWLS
jgi:hypothetical protein